MKRLFLMITVLMLLMIVQTSYASGPFTLKNKSSLDLKFSMRDYNNSNNFYDYYNDGSFDETSFSIGVSYWNTENSAFSFAVGASKVEDAYYDSDLGLLHARNYVVPIYLGTRFYLTDNGGYSPVKPFFAISAGPVLGVIDYEDYDRFFDVKDDVYLAFGTYLGGGVDFMFGQRMMVGFNAGYNFQTDFKEYIGDRDNYSGGEIGINVGFLFGGDRGDEGHRRPNKRVIKF